MVNVTSKINDSREVTSHIILPVFSKKCGKMLQSDVNMQRLNIQKTSEMASKLFWLHCILI